MTARLHIVALIAAVLIAGGACKRPRALTTWRVTGRVVDARGESRSGLKITLGCANNMPSETTKTDASGRFEFDGDAGSGLLEKYCMLTIEGGGVVTIPASSACVRTYGDIDARPCGATEGTITY